MRLILLSLLISTGALAQTAPTPPSVGNFVYVEQIGDYNTTFVQQTDSEQKRATVTSTGNNNNTSILQEGTGNHTASVQSLTGSNNVINLSQSGAGNHEVNIINMPNTTNSNNTISTTQTGGAGSDKWFNVWLNSTNGATVNVLQNNATTPDQASMSVQCFSNCGTWSYTKN
jgi:hypothetical protein